MRAAGRAAVVRGARGRARRRRRPARAARPRRRALGGRRGEASIDVDLAFLGETRSPPPSDRAGGLMQLDVVTLFPEWFEWFRGQRHVANALAQRPRAAHAQPARAHAAERRPGRRHAVRRRRRDGAARRRHGRRAARLLRRRPGRPAPPAPRARAHARRADARRPLRRRARRRARDHAAVRALRGLRRAHRPALRLRRGVDRPLRAVGRRAGGDGRHATPSCASCPARSATPTRRVEESFSAALGRRSRVPALHAPRRVPRLAGARGAALGPPRGDPPAGAGRAAASVGRRAAVLRYHEPPARDR